MRAFSDLNVALEVGAQFEQQTASAGGGIPDASIFQSSFRLVIETKRGPEFSPEQLGRHLSAFGAESLKVLLLLMPERDLVALPDKPPDVHVVSRTFSDLIAACRDASLHANTSLRELVEDYEQYCHDSDLFAGESERLLVVPVGTTLGDNLELLLYYAPSTRRFQKHTYLGLYAGKRVQALGRVENVVTAEIASGDLVIQQSSQAVSPDQKDRIREAIARAPNHGYDISLGHTFSLVAQFFETEFRKSSSGGLPGKRYFNLREELAVNGGAELPDIVHIARALRERTWQ